MQSPMAQPDAGTVPDQELQPRRATIAKGVGIAVARGCQEILDPLRQAVDAAAHVHRFNWKSKAKSNSLKLVRQRRQAF